MEMKFGYEKHECNDPHPRGASVYPWQHRETLIRQEFLPVQTDSIEILRILD